MMEKKEQTQPKKPNTRGPRARPKHNLVRQYSDGGPARPGSGTQNAVVGWSSFSEGTTTAAQVTGAVPVSRRKTDVLLGRGKGITQWHGNKVFQTVVEDYQAKYDETPRDARGFVCNEVVAEVKKWGRFLERSKTDGSWYVADDEKAKKKVGQALRYRIRQQSNAAEVVQRNSSEENPFSDTEDSSIATFDSPRYKRTGADASQGENQSPTLQSQNLRDFSMSSSIQQYQKPPAPVNVPDQLQDFPEIDSAIGSHIFEPLRVMDQGQHMLDQTPEPDHQATRRSAKDASAEIRQGLGDTKPAAKPTRKDPPLADNSLRTLVTGPQQLQQHPLHQQQHHAASWDAPKPFSLVPLSVSRDTNNSVVLGQHQASVAHPAILSSQPLDPPNTTQTRSISAPPQHQQQQPPLLTDFEILDAIGYGNIAFLNAPQPNRDDETSAAFADDLSISTVSS